MLFKVSIFEDLNQCPTQRISDTNVTELKHLTVLTTIYLEMSH